MLNRKYTSGIDAVSNVTEKRARQLAAAERALKNHPEFSKSLIASLYGITIEDVDNIEKTLNLT